MESHIKLPSSYVEYTPSDDWDAKQWFKRAFEFANAFYKHELDRASSVKFSEVGPNTFFQEYIWVVHATGFSAKAVTKFIGKLTEAYGNYKVLASDINKDRLPGILSVCNNKQKADAVYRLAKLMNDGISEHGWNNWKNKEISTVDSLSKLPYVGNITKYHLGRNIGMLDCVKPDLHFVRMASHWNYVDANEMIKDMSDGYNIPLGIADMMAWYYASTFGTTKMKKDGVR